MSSWPIPLRAPMLTHATWSTMLPLSPSRIHVCLSGRCHLLTQIHLPVIRQSIPHLIRSHRYYFPPSTFVLSYTTPIYRPVRQVVQVRCTTSRLRMSQYCTSLLETQPFRGIWRVPTQKRGFFVHLATGIQSRGCQHRRHTAFFQKTQRQ